MQQQHHSKVLLREGSSSLSSSFALARSPLPSRPSTATTSRHESKKKLTLDPSKTTKELLESVEGVLRRRRGTLLTASSILKSDHYSSGRETEFDVQGAPNFRAADFNIYGSAQPTVTGIATVLSLLNCQPSTAPSTQAFWENGQSTPSHPQLDPAITSAIWISAREEPTIYINKKPFVLRDRSAPFKNISTYQGISASRLEQMEDRLKEDVIREAETYHDLILVHEESSTISSSTAVGKSSVRPSWCAVLEVQTPREVFDAFGDGDYRVDYYRTPLSPEHPPDERYLQELISILKDSPSSSAVIFNCGMGVGRTTFAMVVAMTMRAATYKASLGLELGVQSPMPFQETSNSANEATLKLFEILEASFQKSKDTKSGIEFASSSAIQWAFEHVHLMDDLRNAVLGNYQLILQLSSTMEPSLKRQLDSIINRCDDLINLRENVLHHRLQYSMTEELSNLDRAVFSLGRYFYLLVFTSYVQDVHPGYAVTFTEWLAGRSEISSMLSYLSKAGNKLNLFRPIADLSFRPVSRDQMATGGHRGSLQKPPVAQHPAPQLDELEAFVIKSRSGSVLVPYTFLKMDNWSNSALAAAKQNSVIPLTFNPAADAPSDPVPGAHNFRRIKDSQIYGVAQPTMEGIRNVLESIIAETPRKVSSALWINLREEPLIYINGIPYVLRDQYSTLRNLKSYSGITSSRLEAVEDKLVEDLTMEQRSYEGRLLLHTEIDGHIIPVWEDVSSAQNGTQPHISTIRSVMRGLVTRGGLAAPESWPVKLEYCRIPFTAETAPTEVDFDTLVSALCKVNVDETAIILNCQVGQGRSTLGTVVAMMTVAWLKGLKTIAVPDKKYPNYQITHSLLRVIRNGLECKATVDLYVDECGMIYNVRDLIDYWTNKAKSQEPSKERDKCIAKAGLHLQRYFMLIVLASYFDQNPPGQMSLTLPSFSAWVAAFPEIVRMKEELSQVSWNSLKPIVDVLPEYGKALTSEVLEVLTNRAGQVLANGTILKFDLFPGAQKLSLPSRVEGAPNFRKIPLPFVRGLISGSSATIPGNPSWTPHDSSKAPVGSEDGSELYSSVCGVGMPTRDAIRNILNRLGSHNGRSVIWTSLREEPVIYVNGRPYVLRYMHDVYKNLETTGIPRARVEAMETQLKVDLLAELKRYNGVMLLHEEIPDPNNPSSFSVVPCWETVQMEDVLTPLEVYQGVQNDGYHVDYLRIPITDEQAPIPDVFDQLVHRLLGARDQTEIIFNCQMGRGRTTTGMVITCLMEMIVGNPDVLDQTSPIGRHLWVSDESTASSEELDRLNLSSSFNLDDTQRFLGGNYRVILQLVAVLSNGKVAKRLTDRACDVCEHMQNLRVAINDYRLNLASADPKSSKYHRLFEIGCNYLIRYFYLVCFADYLLEVWSRFVPDNLHPAEHPTLTFSDWLHERREIQYIIRKENQTLD